MRRAANKVFRLERGDTFHRRGCNAEQNGGVYANHSLVLPEACQHHFHYQELASVMVWAGIASDGPKARLLFLHACVKINIIVYVHMLRVKMLLGDSYFFPLNGAPTHASNMTQNRCKDHFSGFSDKII